MIPFRKLRFLAAAAALLVPSFAHAGLIGQNVTMTYDFFGTKYVDNVTVTNGIEITCPGSASACSALTYPTQTVDIGNDYIRYQVNSTLAPVQFNSGLGFNGFRFSGLNLPQPISSTYSFSSNILLASGAFTAGSSTFDINMNGLEVGNGSYWEVRFDPQPIPEPSTYAILGAAGVLLAAAVRRRSIASRG